MAITALRPTGNRILPRASTTLKFPIFGNYHTCWLNSGTAALALAIIAAETNNRAVQNPEVILPAYGCPDLVAAAHYAGARAVLADIQLNSPNFDYDSLNVAISENTVAIVAPTLLGLRADPLPLRKIIGNRSIVLIEDSAQWFPRGETQEFFGDSIVLSFGRGKPVNVLGGGALLAKEPLPKEVMSRIDKDDTESRIKDHLRILAYNTLIRPSAYGLAEKLPMLHIGQTKYKALTKISAMPDQQKALLANNLTAFLTRSLEIQHQWRRALAELPSTHLVDLIALHPVPADYALLRYPVLIRSKPVRDRVFSRLRQHGLGASIMYGQPLIEFAGIQEHATVYSDIPNARLFAGHLLTLPTHEAVTAKTVRDTITLLKSELS